MDLTPEERAQLERYRSAARRDYILSRVVGIPLFIVAALLILRYLMGFL